MELTLDQALQKGIEAHKAGKAKEADQYYTAILKANPKHPDANHNMGVLAIGIGKVQEALPFFKTALEVKPEVAQYSVSYIQALLKIDRIDDAKEVLEQAKHNGITHKSLDKLGKLIGSSNSMNSSTKEPSQEQLQSLINLHTQAQYNDAQAEASKLLKHFSHSATLYNILGSVNRELGKLDEAIQAYYTALSIKPKYAEAYYNMGNALKEKGDLDAALKAFRQAVSLKPRFVEAHYNIGNILVSQNELETAEEVYKKVIAVEPSHVKAYINLGYVLKNLSKFDEALATYKKARAIDPQNAMIYNNLGNTYREQGKPKEALENYKKLIYYEPDNPTAKHMIASLTGDNTNTAPKEYVERLFDDFASRFEKSLVNELGYEVPKTVVDIVRNQFGKNEFGTVLDLGCGTGLLGEEIRKYCKKLEGIDLSASMLQEAKKKNIYDKTDQVELIEYLASETLNFDYYFSLDVFIYVGNLSEIFRLIKTRNQKKGKLILTDDSTKILLQNAHSLEIIAYLLSPI